MAAKTKTRQITIFDEKGTFSTLFRMFSGEKSSYNFEGLSALRNLLSNERARILHVIKEQKPKSIYGLAKNVKRDFKSVHDDVRLLERFGFIELISEKTKKRDRLRPVTVVDSINIEVKI